MRKDLVTHGARLDNTRPADSTRNAIASFPVLVFFTAERRRATVRPREALGAVVGRIHYDRVVIEAKFLELVEDLADVTIVLDHTVRISPKTGHALGLIFQVREDMHSRRVPPQEERFVRFLRLFEVIKC